MPFFSIGKLVARSAVGKPATRLYPAERRPVFETTRGRIGIDIDACVFCNMCARKCPAGAIVVERREKTWQIDHLACVLCGHCVEVCPKHCLVQKNTAAPPAASRKPELHRAASGETETA